MITRLFENKDLKEVRNLARQITQMGKVWVLFGLNAEKSHLIFARSEGTDYNLNELVDQLAPFIGGHGGGRPNFVEIGGHQKSYLDKALRRGLIIVEDSIL